MHACQTGTECSAAREDGAPEGALHAARENFLHFLDYDSIGVVNIGAITIGVVTVDHLQRRCLAFRCPARSEVTCTSSQNHKGQQVPAPLFSLCTPLDMAHATHALDFIMRWCQWG